MSLNHHILAKTTTDAVLHKFKTAEWSYGQGKGKDFYRVGTSAEFPSPDAAFFDPTTHAIASFEFKPPTETKRGILTGVGQSIAYLQTSSLAYLVAPQMLEDYDLGHFLKDLYGSQIHSKIPAGLILYDNNNPSNVELAFNVTSDLSAVTQHAPSADRFWAKHQDLPLPLFHLILHYYYLKRVGIISEDPFKACFKNEFITPTIADDFISRPFILDTAKEPIKTVAGTKNIVFLEKILGQARKLPPDQGREKVLKAIDTDFTGDNYYNSIRKNFLSFMKHLQVIDSENTITEKGFQLYHIGLVNGPSSKVFTDYFIKEVLTTGHHLELILDIDALSQEHRDWEINKILGTMETAYTDRGMLKFNPNRQVRDDCTVSFLKYERILWNALSIMKNDGTIEWKKITEICSLPDYI